MVPAWAAAVHRNGISDGRGWRSACHVDALGALRRGDAGDDRRIAVAGGGTMTYVAIMALVVVATMVFQARGVIAVILSNPKMQVGDYDGALRITRWVSLGFPNPLLLHREGLTLSLAGRLKRNSASSGRSKRAMSRAVHRPGWRSCGWRRAWRPRRRWIMPARRSNTRNDARVSLSLGPFARTRHGRWRCSAVARRLARRSRRRCACRRRAYSDAPKCTGAPGWRWRRCSNPKKPGSTSRWGTRRTRAASTGSDADRK